MLVVLHQRDGPTVTASARRTTRAVQVVLVVLGRLVVDDGGNVVDVDTGNVMMNAVVIVTGGRISAVGPAASPSGLAARSRAFSKLPGCQVCTAPSSSLGMNRV